MTNCCEHCRLHHASIGNYCAQPACPCHHLPPQPVEGWEERFDETMIEDWLDADAHSNRLPTRFNFADLQLIGELLNPRIKSFITNLLSRVKEQETALLSRIKEEEIALLSRTNLV